MLVLVLLVLVLLVLLVLVLLLPQLLHLHREHLRRANLHVCIIIRHNKLRKLSLARRHRHFSLRSAV